MPWYHFTFVNSRGVEVAEAVHECTDEDQAVERLKELHLEHPGCAWVFIEEMAPAEIVQRQVSQRYGKQPPLPNGFD